MNRVILWLYAVTGWAWVGNWAQIPDEPVQMEITAVDWERKTITFGSTQKPEGGE